jgi:hypothetical protein
MMPHFTLWCRYGLFPVCLSVLAGCASSPPSNLYDICEIFAEKSGWYDAAAEAQEEWGSPIPVMMAFMYQESRFNAKAKPPRKKIFGFIPGPRPSDAYGYSQALGTTWDAYRRSAGKYWADRDEFDDAVDFVGWYNEQSWRRSGIAKNDSYRLYLAYHEGQGGYNRGTYRKKPWLIDVAHKVERKANTYTSQLKRCEGDLKNDSWFFGLF